MPDPRVNWNQRGERLLARVLTAAVTSRLARKNSVVSLRLVGAARMRDLNGAYRKKDFATDVLSFPAPAIFARQGILGELVICLPVLKRQAKEAGHSPEREFEILLVHGLLHLLGYDHEEGLKEAQVMQRAERNLLLRAFRRKTPGLIGRSFPV